MTRPLPAVTPPARLPAPDRACHLLRTAVTVAAATNWATLTREAVAAAAGVSPALVSARLGDAAQMRRSVMRAAVRDRVLPVVAQGLAVKDWVACQAGPELKHAASEWLREVKPCK